MKPAALDRLMLTWIGTALVVWVACLVILWGWALDTSGVSSVLALASAMLAVAAAAPLPGRLARAFQGMMIRLGRQDVGAMELTMAAPFISQRRDALAAVRLLGIAAVFAALCGLASTLAILAGRAIVLWLSRWTLWTPFAWTVLKIAVQAVAMLPIALAICVVFHLGALIRGGSGRDPYAAAFRVWLWSLAAGLLVFGAAWLAGANLVGLAAVCGVALLAAAAGLLVRREQSVGAQRRQRQIENRPGLRIRLSVAFSFAILALICAIQARMLTDIVGLDIGWCACCAALSVGLLAAMMRQVDRRPRPPARTHGAGAAMGVVAAAVMQSALGLILTAGGGASGLWAALAVAAQVPLAACGAIVLSRQRRLFAGMGGRPRAYLACVCAGSAAGLLAYVAIGWASLSAIWLLGLATALLASAAIVGIAAATEVSGQVGWAACGAALAGALAAGAVVSIERAGGTAGNAVGAWLTTVSDAGSPPGPLGFLPSWRLRARRSIGVSNAVEGVLAARSGAWWLVVGSVRDLPAEMPPRVVAVASSPDPSADGLDRPKGWEALHGLWEPSASVDFFRPASADGRTFDGIFLAPMPADQPQAWRCYNDAAIERCASRLNPGGVMMLRTQARADRLSSALAAAATFHSVVGSSWVVVDLGDDDIDLMMVGPAARVARPAPQAGLYVVPSDKLLSVPAEIGPIRISSPMRAFRGGEPGVESLRRRLASAQ